MLKSTRILSCAMILSSLYLISCDEEYDLTKDINTDITIGNQFRIPAGHSDTIYLSRIIDESETLTENNGIYEVTSTGNTDTHVDPFDEVSIHNFTPVLENININIPSSGTVPDGTKVEAGKVSSTGNYDVYEELPKEVEYLYCADFKGGKASTYLRLTLGNIPGGVQNVTLSNFTMTFPDFMRLENGSNLFSPGDIVLDAANPVAQYEINVQLLEIPRDQQGRYIVTESTGTKYLRITDALEITADASLTLGGSLAANSVEVQFEYFMTEETANLNQIAGVFNTTANITSEISIDDIPDFLRSENTSLEPQEIYLYLDLDNPVNITGDINLDMKSINETQANSASVDVTVQPAAMNKILISNFNASAGEYTTVVEPDLTNLFRFVPDKIEINSNDLTLTSRDNSQMMALGQRYDISADYRAVVPFKFNNLNIEYTDTIDNLLSDLEDVADKTDRLIVKATGVTNIPTDMVTAVKLYDIYGDELYGINVNVDKFKFKAAAGGQESINELELELTEMEGSDDLERLEKIVYTVTATSMSNVTLRPKQYLLVKNIFIEIPNGINLSL